MNIFVMALTSVGGVVLIIGGALMIVVGVVMIAEAIEKWGDHDAGRKVTYGVACILLGWIVCAAGITILGVGLAPHMPRAGA